VRDHIREFMVTFIIFLFGESGFESWFSWLLSATVKEKKENEKIA
jgi:hypothetical protein